MINLHDISYVRLGCRDLAEMVDFSTRILGLELRLQENDRAYLRADSSHHNICYIKDDGPDVVAFEVDSRMELENAERVLSSVDITSSRGTIEEARDRRVADFLQFVDVTGNHIELVFGPEETGTRYFPSRDAGITSFGHFALHTSNVQRSVSFWTGVMGAQVSDMVGEGALLRIDEVHHKLALFPSQKSGVQHVNFQVDSIDDVMRSWYFLQDKGVPIVFGPGRHPTSTAIFLYFAGPDDRIYEYSFGVKRIDDDENHVIRHFEDMPSSFCMWGSRPKIAEFGDQEERRN